MDTWKSGLTNLPKKNAAKIFPVNVRKTIKKYFLQKQCNDFPQNFSTDTWKAPLRTLPKNQRHNSKNLPLNVSKQIAHSFFDKNQPVFLKMFIGNVNCSFETSVEIFLPESRHFVCSM